MSDIEYLDALGWELAECGWRVAIRYGEARLWVVHSSKPDAGELVNVASEPGGPWFRSSTGELLARCNDLTAAVQRVELMIRSYGL